MACPDFDDAVGPPGGGTSRGPVKFWLENCSYRVVLGQHGICYVRVSKFKLDRCESGCHGATIRLQSTTRNYGHDTEAGPATFSRAWRLYASSVVKLPLYRAPLLNIVGADCLEQQLSI